MTGLTAEVVPLAVGAVLLAGISSRDLARWAPGRRPGPPRRGARWARRGDLRALRVRAAPAPPGRLLLGVLPGGLAAAIGPAAAIAAEPGQSLVVVGPTQSGKTTSLAVPAILSWPGPVLAASVKTDLLRDTQAARARRGRVWRIDPTGCTGVAGDEWSPLGGCGDWRQACAVSTDLCQAAKADGTTGDGEFWYATAAKLLAPLFYAAALDRRTMADVVRWVDTQEVGEVAAVLEQSGAPEALDAARATWCRDDRTRSSVYTTAETVLAPFAHGTATPASSRTSTPSPTPMTPARFEPAQLMGGTDTLYLCAPAHDQRRLRGYFTALTAQVLTHAFETATRAAQPLDPPLLVVLDEAAHIAPLAELDALAATCASHGIQLVTIWQDLAQVRGRYGTRAPTVLNNHRAKLFLPGIADPDTLDYASRLVGDEEVTQPSVTRDPTGRRSTTSTTGPRRLLPPEELRCLPRGQAVLVYGTLPPVRLRLRPWWVGTKGATRPARPASRRW
ncbi:MAG TPA: type IV secretory system conjugative DNA transfer family protein [Acidimicrobiales bacterium]|nr:type IV secretory system conjugative DNA transfer family protein [Acidimicrobiales bacterium]